MYDIFFLSYDEPNADSNFNLLKSKHPQVKRTHGVKGILNAHQECAKRSLTKYFFVVDGDNIILDNFKFEVTDTVNTENVLVWRSINSVNKLIYGYGGVKLLPKSLILNMPELIVDMTTSLSTHFKIVNTIASITKFDTSPFNTWRGAFRECVKLSSKIIDRQKDDQTSQRLDVWCSERGNSDFGEFAINGALEGKKYGNTYKNNIDKLKLMNDFAWLNQYFNEVNNLRK